MHFNAELTSTGNKFCRIVKLEVCYRTPRYINGFHMAKFLGGFVSCAFTPFTAFTGRGRQADAEVAPHEYDAGFGVSSGTCSILYRPAGYAANSSSESFAFIFFLLNPVPRLKECKCGARRLRK